MLDEDSLLRGDEIKRLSPYTGRKLTCSLSPGCCWAAYCWNCACVWAFNAAIICCLFRNKRYQIMMCDTAQNSLNQVCRTRGSRSLLKNFLISCSIRNRNINQFRIRLDLRKRHGFSGRIDLMLNVFCLYFDFNIKFKKGKP